MKKSRFRCTCGALVLGDTKTRQLSHPPPHCDGWTAFERGEPLILERLK